MAKHIRKGAEMHTDKNGQAVTVGDRVRLLVTSDVFTDLQSGNEGIVTRFDDLHTMFVDWETGSTLGLVPGEDEFIVVA